MRNQTLRVYSKFCIDCVWPEQWAKIQKWAARNGFRLDVDRTTYHPLRHEKATKIWGGDDYRAFVVSPKGFPIDVLDLAKCLTIEGGWHDDMPGLRRTKDAFGEVEPLVASKKDKPKITARRKRSRRNKVNAS